MKIDFSDVFAGGLGLVVRQIFLFIAAVWLGCTMAAVALMAGEIADHPGAVGFIDGSDLRILLFSPLLLLTLWLLPNLIFLGIMGCRLVIYSESTGFRTWAVLIGGEALFAMAGVTREFKHEWLPLTAAWICWLILTGMLITGLWFLHQWRMNRWAGELAALHAENAMRRRDLKECMGTESVGVDETG